MSETLVDELGHEAERRAGPAWFVGGVVRDALLGLPLKDVDLVVSGDPLRLGRILAGRRGGHAFWLREEDQVARVLLPEDGLQLDLSHLRTPLEEDLRARDLTINALALPAAGGIHGNALVDPTGGLADLHARLLRFPRGDAAEQDPLRVLRLIRFRHRLGFRIHPETGAAARAAVALTARVSGERIRDELFLILGAEAAAAAIAELWEWGLQERLTGVAGEPEFSPGARLVALRKLPTAAVPELDTLLALAPVPPRSRRGLLEWAAVLHAVGPAVQVERATRMLALGNEERTLIARGLAAAPAVARLAEAWPVAGRERYRFLRAAGAAAPEAVLLAAAASGWSAVHEQLLTTAVAHLLHPPVPLLDGREVMALTGCRPGPGLGRLLEALEEARADGLVTSPEEARRWVSAAANRQAAQENLPFP